MLDLSSPGAAADALGLGALFALAVKLTAVRLGSFATMAVVLVPLERLLPFQRRQRLFRAHLWHDFLHFFVGGILIIVVMRVTWLALYAAGWNELYTSPLSVRGKPYWFQLLVYELGWTGLGYWLHRLMHSSPALWRMHSIHESSRELDWLAGFRMHWLEPCFFHVFTILPLFVVFQVDHPVAMAYTVYAFVHAHVQHANVVLPLGPLKYVVPSPDFHRWHHASEGEKSGGASNYGAYPFWDILFGTFHWPKEKPKGYGYAAEPVPMDYLAQQAYPFGGHETVLRWKQALREAMPLDRLLPPLAERVRPWHDALESGLHRLCLLPPAPAPSPEPAAAEARVA